MSVKQSTKDTFKSMIIIHLVICLSVVVIMGILYTLTVQSGKHLNPADEFKILEIILPITGLGSFFGARFIINKRMKAIEKTANLNSKVEAYRSSMIVLWAVLEGTALFGAIGFFVSGRQNLFLYGLMAAVFIVFFRPLRSKIAQDLNLSAEEINQLNQK